MANKIIQFIDKHFLFGYSLFLLLFIPLYPKWPAFDALPGYNVRIRLEDFLILLGFIFLAIQFFRRKINLQQIPLFKPIAAYIVVGFLSTLSAIFITQTVTTESYQVMKLYLHYFRRIEYLSLFFIFYLAIHSKQQIKAYLYVMLAAVSGAIIYGFGQKYLYWPAYSTMNREFSKGITLYLTEHARVLSTFGGHYDLAAYIMLTLPLVIIMLFATKKIWFKIVLAIIALAEYWLLILTASRTSFVAFLVAITITFALLAYKHNVYWAISRWFIVTFISLAIMLTVGPMSERFAHIIKLQDLKTNLTKAIKPPPTGGIAINENLSLEQQLEIVASKTDIPPSPIKPTPKPQERPDDVYVDPYTQEDQIVQATDSGEATPTAVVHADYSENALKYGLSTGIRLDALWPRAIAAFKQNPFLGTGYSTLVKTAVWEQTQAESTDNDYLRLLGETGLLGFLTFLSIFALTIYLLFKAMLKADDFYYAGIFAAGIGISIGYMVNAIYIDVFESSKVAYTYWSLIGIMLATATFYVDIPWISKNESQKQVKKTIKST